MGYLRDVVWKDEYKYYDTPEGQDCGKKIWYVTKYSGIYGLGVATFDIIGYSHTRGYANTIGRYAYFTFPLMGIGAAFAAATCASTNIRKKDDPFNYSVGAIATAAVWGAWKKSFRIGVYGGFFGAIVAAVYKDLLEKDLPIFDTKTSARIHIFPWTLNQDWTLLKDPGKTWKTTE